MQLDIGKVLQDMFAAAKNVIAADWPKVEGCVEQAIRNQAAELKEIAEARLRDELTDDEVKSELQDAAETIKAELLACKVKSRVMAQEAANAAVAVLQGAIKAALKVA